MIRNKGDFRVESVHRALMLLNLMAEGGSLSVTEAAKALEVNPSTAQRLLATLAGDGFAVQGARKRYEPGPAFLRPGVMHAEVPLRARVRPHLERLYGRTGETVHLATLIGTEIHHLDGIEATLHPLRFGLRTGVRMPAHIASGGKVMLADLSKAELDARYHVAMLGPRGSRLGVDLARLHQELEMVRAERIASNFEESEPGLAAFSISLGAVDGERAALSVALPIARYSPEKGQKFIADLITTADEVRAGLSFPTPGP